MSSSGDPHHLAEGVNQPTQGAILAVLQRVCHLHDKDVCVRTYVARMYCIFVNHV